MKAPTILEVMRPFKKSTSFYSVSNHQAFEAFSSFNPIFHLDLLLSFLFFISIYCKHYKLLKLNDIINKSPHMQTKLPLLFYRDNLFRFVSFFFSDSFFSNLFFTL